MVTLENYQNNMKEKYKDILNKIDRELLSIDSWSRGRLLIEILEESNIPEELKYYVFCDWWTSIDSFHNVFSGEDIKEWIKTANIDMESEIWKNLIVDEEGYIKVYRGTHEHSQSWDGLSWTTDMEIAIKFANGCGVRHQTKYPAILSGRVAYFNVIGIFDNRQEKEVLCYVVDCQDNVENLY